MNNENNANFKVVIQLLLRMITLLEDKKNSRKDERKQVLDAADLEVIFHRSSRTIRRWNKRGILKSVEINGISHFLWEDISPLIQSKSEQDGKKGI